MYHQTGIKKGPQFVKYKYHIMTIKHNIVYPQTCDQNKYKRLTLIIPYSKLSHVIFVALEIGPCLIHGKDVEGRLDI